MGQRRGLIADGFPGRERLAMELHHGERMTQPAEQTVTSSQTLRRHMPIPNESPVRRTQRCNCIAQRQASQKGRQTNYTEGQQVGPHTFVGFVGGREDALYIYLKCKCGNVFHYKRDQVSQLSRVKSNGKSVEHCKACAPNNNQHSKAGK